MRNKIIEDKKAADKQAEVKLERKLCFC